MIHLIQVIKINLIGQHTLYTLFIKIKKETCTKESQKEIVFTYQEKQNENSF